MYSLLIKNATVIDGSGNPGRVADVAIEQDQIVLVGPNLKAKAHTEIDGTGQILAPGFVDIQNHSDSYWQLLENPGLDSLVAQGYTTIMVGHCGGSLAPLLSTDALNALQKWRSLEGMNTDWDSFAVFGDAMRTKQFGTNVGSFVGYGTLRRGLVGDSTEPLSEADQELLLATLRDAFDQGAFGVSCSLSYADELRTSVLDLIDVAKLAAEKSRLVSIHLRNEAEGIVDSVQEIVELARHSGAHVKISHLKIRNRGNWQLLPEVLEHLEVAKHQGVHINYDIYPYTTTWQSLASYLPGWSTEGGRVHLLHHLKTPSDRKKILDFLTSSSNHIASLVLSSTSHHLNGAGKSLARIAKDMGVSTEEAMLELASQGGSEVLVFDPNLDEQVVEKLAMHPLGMLATDGGGFSLDPMRKTEGNDRLIHPRSFGSSAKFLAMVRQSKSISWEQAIYKLATAPAAKLGLTKRGTINVGSFADLVLFDPETVNSHASILNPYQPPIGISHVITGGTLSIAGGEVIGLRGGRFLKK